MGSDSEQLYESKIAFAHPFLFLFYFCNMLYIGLLYIFIFLLFAFPFSCIKQNSVIHVGCTLNLVLRMIPGVDCLGLSCEELKWIRISLMA